MYNVKIYRNIYVETALNVLWNVCFISVYVYVYICIEMYNNANIIVKRIIHYSYNTL